MEPTSVSEIPALIARVERFVALYIFYVFCFENQQAKLLRRIEITKKRFTF